MKFKDFFQKIPGSIYIFILIMIIGTLITPYFLTFSNFSKIIYQSAILLMIATGSTLVITTGEIDLSLGAVLSLSSMITALVMEKGISFLTASFCGLLTGLICGGINAFFIVKAKVPSYISTFGLMNMATGLALGLRSGATIRGLDERFSKIIGGNLGPIPVVVIISTFCFLIVAVLFHYGKLGTYLCAIGSDRDGAGYAGINVDLYRGLPFIISGLLAGIAGVVFSARLNLGHPTGGVGYEFEAIAATIVGGNAMEGGRSSMVNTLLGVGVLSILKNSLTMLGYPIWWQMAISGVVLILALIVPNLLKIYQLYKESMKEI